MTRILWNISIYIVRILSNIIACIYSLDWFILNKKPPIPSDESLFAFHDSGTRLQWKLILSGCILVVRLMWKHSLIVDERMIHIGCYWEIFYHCLPPYTSLHWEIYNEKHIAYSCLYWTITYSYIEVYWLIHRRLIWAKCGNILWLLMNDWFIVADIGKFSIIVYLLI